MGAVVGQFLSAAVGVAISPVPVIALILMLLSANARRNALAFTLGWLVGLAGLGVVVLALGLEAGSSGEDASGIAKIVIGALFLVLAVRQWRSRPAEGEEPKMPAWMATVSEFTVAKSIGMGLLLTVPNPKNAGLTIAAAMTISTGGLATGQELAALAIFVLLASVTILGPVIVVLLTGDRAQAPLDALRAWLVADNATVMAILFLVLGAKVLGDGIALATA